MPGDGAGDGVVRDSRFKALHNDPRFMNFPAATDKTKIDGRFAKMFSDPNFGTGARGNRDKRGRRTDKAKRKSAADDLKRYYDLEEEEEEEEERRDGEAKKSAAKKKTKAKKAKGKAEKARIKVDSDPSESEDDDADDPSDADAPEDPASESGSESDLDHRLEASRDRMRGANLSDSSDSDSDSDSDADGAAVSESEEGVIPRMLAGGATKNARDDGEEEPEEPGMIDATDRLAVVDQEWQHLRAVDLLVVLRSFAPQSGAVRRVTVYPSDFGLKRMAEEARHGPLAAFGKSAGDAAARESAKKKKARRKSGVANASANARSSVDPDDSASDAFTSSSESESDAEEDADAVRERMRQYERDRMTYYYAICECDSAETARAVYAACDGLEFERSANKLDLRYVPNGQSFEGRDVRDEASSVPSDYEPPEFQVKALQQTNVKLSWDDDDPARKKAFARKLTEDKLKDEDFAAYMASASESSESEEEFAAPVPERLTKKSATSGKPKKRERLSEADAAAAKKAYLAKLLGGGDETGGGAREDDSGGDDDSDSGGDDDPGDSDAGDSASEEGFKRAAWGSGDVGDAQNRYGDKATRRRAASGRGGGGDMEVTFHAGLEELGEKMRRRKKELSGEGAKETVWEKRLREKAEKREKKKQQKKKDGEEDDTEGEKIRTDDVDADEKFSGFDDPFFADDGDVDFDAVADDDSGDDVVGEGRKNASRARSSRDDDVFALTKRESKKASKRRAQHSADDPETAKERADLELLMMDDDLGLGGGANETRATRKRDGASAEALAPVLSKKKSRKARLAEKKKLRGKDARRRESDDEDDEKSAPRTKVVDVSDDRFAGLFESEKFALDPTDPRFRETKAADFIAEERARRRQRKNARTHDGDKVSGSRGERGEEPRKSSENGAFSSRNGAGDAALSAMVRGLKRKSEAASRERGGSKRR